MLIILVFNLGTVALDKQFINAAAGSPTLSPCPEDSALSAKLMAQSRGASNVSDRARNLRGSGASPVQVLDGISRKSSRPRTPKP
jgi:hypothetical protein